MILVGRVKNFAVLYDASNLRSTKAATKHNRRKQFAGVHQT